MINAFYTSATATQQLQYGFDVIANNIANVTNQGFKASQISFTDLLHTNIRDAESVSTNLNTGHGSKLTKTNVAFQQGSLQPTGNMLDFALTGSGFFAVSTTDGIKYTRSGSTQLTEIEGQMYLTSTLGGLVLDQNKQPIVVTDATQQVIDVGVFDFENSDGLVRAGSNYFVPGTTSGEISLAEDAEVKRGYLESSTVNVAQEMSNVIEYQRAFQFNSKLVQISDEVIQIVNNLR